MSQVKNSVIAQPTDAQKGGNSLEKERPRELTPTQIVRELDRFKNLLQETMLL